MIFPLLVLVLVLIISLIAAKTSSIDPNWHRHRHLLSSRSWQCEQQDDSKHLNFLVVFGICPAYSLWLWQRELELNPSGSEPASSLDSCVLGELSLPERCHAAGLPCIEPDGHLVFDVGKIAVSEGMGPFLAASGYVPLPRDSTTLAVMKTPQIMHILSVAEGTFVISG